MQRGNIDQRRNRWRIAPALLCALAATLAAPGFVSAAKAAEPGLDDESAKAPLCCGVPPGDEVTADQVFGRWVVRNAGIGAPVRTGENVDFRADGTLSTARGPCRFAVLRAELTVTCAAKSDSGEVRFVDDTKMIWRLDGKDLIFIAPAE